MHCDLGLDEIFLNVNKCFIFVYFYHVLMENNVISCTVDSSVIVTYFIHVTLYLKKFPTLFFLFCFVFLYFSSLTFELKALRQQAHCSLPPMDQFTSSAEISEKNLFPFSKHKMVKHRFSLNFLFCYNMSPRFNSPQY